MREPIYTIGGLMSFITLLFLLNPVVRSMEMNARASLSFNNKT
jgi:hypothetical protein